MSPSADASRRKLRFSTRLILVLMVIFAIGLAWKMNQVHQEASAVYHVETLGGSALYDVQTWSPDWADPLIRAPVVEVDLSGCDVDARDLQRITVLDNLKRLNLQDTSIGPGDLEALAELEQLQVLRLAGTRIKDSDLVHLQRLENLRILSLNGTDVGNQGLKYLSGLTSLSSLQLDDRQITRQTAKQLAALPRLQWLWVTVPSGIGAEAYQHLAAWPIPQVQVQAVIPPHDGVLWDPTRPWVDSTSGRAELVARAADLDAQQVDMLRRALATVDADGSWGATTPGRTQPQPPRSQVDQFEHFDEYLAALKESKEESRALNEFTYYRSTREDIPKLLEAIQEVEKAGTQEPDSPFWDRSTWLLINRGLAHPEALEFVKRRLQHENAAIRARTVSSFGWWGDPERAPRLTDREAEIALSLLLAACEDENANMRMAAADTIGIFAWHNPDLAAEVVRGVLPLVGDVDSFVRFEAVNAIAYAMQADPDLSPSLAEDVVPLLDAQDPWVEASAIEALGYVARVDRELAISMAPRLLEHITDKNMRVREAAGAGLAHLTGGEHNLAPVVVPALLELFQSENTGEASAARSRAAFHSASPAAESTGVQASAARALARVARSARDRAAEE